MAALNEKAFERKLKEMSNSQDSVQTVSLWIIHHKASSNKIVTIWLDQMKKVKPDRRLTLFYLANDAIQNSRKKGKEVIYAFKKSMKETMELLAFDALKAPVERVLGIWRERAVYDETFIDDLLLRFERCLKKAKQKSRVIKQPEAEKVMHPKKVVVKQEVMKQEVEKKPQKVKRIPPADFKLTKLLNVITSVTDLEADIGVQQQQISNLRVDASSTDALRQLKDRAGLNRFSVEFERSSAKYEEFNESLQKDVEGRKELLKLLEDADAFYEAAHDESQIIANAYKTFGNRLNSLKKKIESKLKKFEAAEAAKKAAEEAAKKAAEEAAKKAVEEAAKKATEEATKKAAVEAEKVNSLEVSGTEQSTTTPTATTQSAVSKALKEVTKQGSENPLIESPLPDDTADSIESLDKGDDESDRSTPSFDEENAIDVTNDNTELADMEIEGESDSDTGADSDTSDADAAKTPQHSSSSTPLSTPQRLTSNTIQSIVSGQAIPTLQQTPAGSFPGLVALHPPAIQPFLPQTPLTPMHGVPQSSLYPIQQVMGHTQPIVPSYMTLLPGYQTQAQMPGYSGIQPGIAPHMLPNQQMQYPGLGQAPTIPNTHTLGLTNTGFPKMMSSTEETHSTPQPIPTMTVSRRIEGSLSLSTTTKTTSSLPDMVVTPQKEKLKQDDMASPESEASAPSPEGSPELGIDEYEKNEFDENEYEEHELTEETFDIINMTSKSQDQSNNVPVVSSGMGSFLQIPTIVSTNHKNSSVNSTSGTAKPPSAVDILAQLISRGRKNKSSLTGDDDTTSGTSTPSEVATPPPTSKPIFTLIDSLFPKLTDSLKALKKKENELGTLNSNDSNEGNMRGHVYKGGSPGDGSAAQEQSHSCDIPEKDGSETPEEAQPQHIITIVSSRKDSAPSDNTLSPPVQMEAPKSEIQGDGSWTTPETTPEHVPRSLQTPWPEGAQEPFGQQGLPPEQMGLPFGSGPPGSRPPFPQHEESAIPGQVFVSSVPQHYPGPPDQQIGWPGPPHSGTMDHLPEERPPYMDTSRPGIPVPQAPFDVPQHRPAASIGQHEGPPRDPLLERPPDEHHRPPFHERLPEEHLRPPFHEMLPEEHIQPPFHDQPPEEHGGPPFHERPPEEHIHPPFHDGHPAEHMRPPFHERPPEEQLHRPPFHVRPEDQRPFFDGPPGSVDRPACHEIQPGPIERQPDGHHRHPFHDGPPEPHHRPPPKGHPLIGEHCRPDETHFDPHHRPPFHGPPEHFQPEAPDRPAFDMHERHAFERPDGRPFDGPPGRPPHRSPRRMSVDRPELAPLSPRARLGHRPDFPPSPFEREGPHGPRFEHPLPPSPHDRHFRYNEPFDRPFPRPGGGPPRHRFPPPNLQEPFSRDHMLKRPGPPMGIHMPYKRPFY